MKNKNIMFSPGLGIRSFRFHAIRTFFRSFALFQKSGGALRSFLFFWKERKDGLLFSLCLKRAEKEWKKERSALFDDFLKKNPVFYWKPRFFGENLGFLSKIFVHNVHKKERSALKKSGSLFRSFQKEWKERIALFKKSGKSGSLFLKWGKS